MSNALAPVTYETDAGGQMVITRDDVVNLFQRGGGRLTDAEMAMFMHRCASLKLDPFSSDVSLVKYGDAPASIIVGKDAFLKRADQHPQYDGMEYGVTVVDQNGNLVRRKGTLLGVGGTLVGGWAEVHRKDRSHPTYAEVSFSEYDTGKSSWKKMPGTMIAKVAKSQALREAFPNVLAGLYEREEMEQVAPMRSAPVEAEAVAVEAPEAAAAAADARTAMLDAVREATREAKAAGVPVIAITDHARNAYGRDVADMNEYELEKLLGDIAGMVELANEPQPEPAPEAEYYEEEVVF